ncbi:39S ribosomal protein L16, mitochondrial [Armadillidium nasatum]|uniref:39S ribosomal protein L16, mitochondrial n=1 Tax=Armadillidium nasatum TaxID=96803 RepID=A0A5N5TB67_9CRUS|nr:39S ribosomal protein L16, mitochondrial [Armadillidium nasatum]
MRPYKMPKAHRYIRGEEEVHIDLLHRQYGIVVERMLRIVAHKLPFPAAVMTQEMIEKQREEEKRLEKENENRFTFKYIVQNNMMGSRFWAKKELDLKYFGKYD